MEDDAFWLKYFFAYEQALLFVQTFQRMKHQVESPSPLNSSDIHVNRYQQISDVSPNELLDYKFDLGKNQTKQESKNDTREDPADDFDDIEVEVDFNEDETCQ